MRSEFRADKCGKVRLQVVLEKVFVTGWFFIVRNALHDDQMIGNFFARNKKKMYRMVYYKGRNRKVKKEKENITLLHSF